MFYYCIKEAVAKGLTDEMPAEGEYIFIISKEEIDNLVNKYFDVNNFDVVESTGKDGIRKLDDNKEVAVTYSVELKSEGTKGEVKYHLVKNANNWKLHCVEYLKK